MNILKNYPNIWFRSDDHFDHSFMVRGMVDENGQLLPGAKVPRPMFSSVNEMNEAMISRHNEVVRKGDLVYDLGDYAVKTTLERALEFRRRMAGNWFLVGGNHGSIEGKMFKLHKAFGWHRELTHINVGEPWFSKEKKQMIVLCHYAMTVWENSHHGSWQLYGHSHGMLPEHYTCPSCQFEELPHKLQFDVGVDCWDFYPVSIEQVKEKMLKKLPAWQAYKEHLQGSGRVE